MARFCTHWALSCVEPVPLYTLVDAFQSQAVTYEPQCQAFTCILWPGMPQVFEADVACAGAAANSSAPAATAAAPPDARRERLRMISPRRSGNASLTMRPAPRTAPARTFH